MKNNEECIFVKNRQALMDYFIIRSLEVGLKLFGDEVKSIKEHSSSLNSSYATFLNDEIFLHDYNINNSVRDIKLLLNKKEIRSLEKDLLESGVTLIPLKVYRNKSYIKLELGVAKGKRKYDKRQDIKDKDLLRVESVKIKI